MSNDPNDIELPKKTLREICEDKEAGASARAQAARTLLELAGALKNTQQHQQLTPSSEMTIDELNARLKAIDEKPTDARVIQVESMKAITGIEPTPFWKKHAREVELGKHLDETERKIGKAKRK